ncbi:AAA family ATPase [Pseudomonas sp. DTU_2021_1001937_2_SI_NGA_ILE_001]|uniref:AAA family ATPase n=1 Tax=Pseudomonas sp. DTU_2021_1001937_2_SI_NGA_ILE_001 TaxID=3077589 RepID=UPI0028FC0FE0|nr:AAA family ATPase [Pseudomonas sp. DTU_2021_1001937_2_SI_NGA_ILE_001]WNW10222.1 AAA family ATPase [Pseudomonas sp. DTU_2021_1001937_2_SI_NGA_ILE_001]
MDFQTLQALLPAPGQEPDWAALMHGIPALLALEGTPQDPLYHAEGNVLIHTRMVVEALLDSAAYAAASTEQRFILFYACLLHDIAKPSTTVIDEATGRIGQPGHSARGAVDARVILWRAGVPFDIRETICRIIAVHQVPFFALNDRRGDKPAEYVVRKLSWELPLWMLCAVASADMQGRGFDGKQAVLDDIELFRLLAEEEGCLHHPRAFADAYTRLAYFQGAKVHPDYALHREREGSSVIVMCGLPASGKNTWVASQHPHLPCVSFDDAREELGLAHGKNEGRVAHHAIDKARQLLRERQPFVWNATHLSRQMRKKTLDLLHGYGAQVTLCYLEQAEKELYRRNSQRDSSLRNKDLARMFHRWEVPTPVEAEAVEYLVSHG